jgi:diaminobutyrate-2-oxoglutarate transaminase
LTGDHVHRESGAASYYRHLPLRPVEASGVWIRDADGRRLLDCLAAAGSMSLGWSHPVVYEAVRKALASDAPLLTLDFPTPLRDDFYTELSASLPPGLAADGVFHLCAPSGANAVEAALTVAELATGGTEHLAVQGGFHGCTRAARSVSGGGGLRHQRLVLGPPAHFLPFPQEYRCPFGAGGPEGVRLAVRAIDRALNDPHSGVANPASVLTEFVLGEGGVLPAPVAWARALREHTKTAGVPLIADEIQAGMYRTGRTWAFEHSGIEPDMMVVSKGLGGGMPIAVLVMRPELNVWEPGAFTGTFRGNALAFAAAAATLRFARDNALDMHVTAMGERMLAGLTEVKLDVESIGEVRGVGLMLGVEIVDARAEPDARGVLPPDPAQARLIQRRCFDNGLLVEVGGAHGNVIRFLPPLIITEAEAGRAVELFATAVADTRAAPVFLPAGGAS